MQKTMKLTPWEVLALETALRAYTAVNTKAKNELLDKLSMALDGNLNIDQSKLAK